MRRGLAVSLAGLALALAGCAPVANMAEGERLDGLRATAAEFCAAHAAGDVERLAALFTDDIAAALRAADDETRRSVLSSRPSDGCQAGRGAYWGGSRHFVELRHGGFSDALDLWLSDQGRISDLQYGARRGGLREALGLRVGAVKPDRLFR